METPSSTLGKRSSPDGSLVEPSEQKRYKSEEEPDTQRKKAQGGKGKCNKTILTLPPPVADLFCQVEQHPFHAWHDLNTKVIAVVEFLIPAHVYPASPHSFFGLTGHQDTQIMTKQILMIFGYLANTISSMRKGKDEEGREIHRMSANTVTVTWERVPHKDNPRLFVAYRLRLTEHGPPNRGLINDLADLIESNSLAMTSRLKSDCKGSDKPKYRSHSSTAAKWATSLVDHDQWKRLCRFYRSVEMRDRENELADVPDEERNDLRSDSCPFTIHEVFSIKASLDIARRLGAHPDYCKLDLYAPPYDHRTQRTNFGFADPDNVWWLSHKDLHPASLECRLLPTAVQNLRQDDLYIKQYQQAQPPGAAEEFHKFCNITSSSDNSNDIVALTERIKQEKMDLKSLYGEDTNEYFEARRFKQIEWSSAFNEVFHKEGDVATAIQCIAGWQEQYLSDNKRSFRLPRKLSMVNIPRFDDLMSQLAVMEETVVTVKTTHKECLLYKLAALHIYARKDLNVHCLVVGPPRVGKSFGLLQIEKLFIEGTVRVLTYITPKALAVEGKSNDCLILVFEDSPSSMLGANVGNKTRGANPVSDDTVNMIKQFLSSMYVSVQTMVIDEGKRRPVFISSPCNCVCFFALNDSSNVFDKAIVSRCSTIISSEEVNADDEGPSMQTKSARCIDPIVKDTVSDIRTWWQRTQCLVANILYRISCGILCEVNMDAFELIFAMIAAQAKKKHNIAMDDPRKLVRLRALITVLVVIDAIDLVWDSPECPFIGQPHNDLHFLLVEKHLVARQQHIFMAIGLLSHEWQDNLRTRVIGVMKKLWFPKASEKIDALGQPVQNTGTVPEAPEAPEGVYIPTFFGNRKPTPAQKKMMEKPETQAYKAQLDVYDGMQEENKNWMYDTCIMGGPLLAAPKTNGGRAVYNDELYNHIANQLMPHLNPRPLLTEVTAIIHALSDTMEDTSRQVYEESIYCQTTERISRPALVVEQDRIRLNLTTLSRSGNSDPLFSAVTDVAAALHYKKREACNRDGRPCAETSVFLYGETEDKERYVWRMIKARPPPVEPGQSTPAEIDKITHVRNPHFFDEPLIYMTGCFINGVVGENQLSGRINKLFKPDNPWTDVNTDMDRYVSLAHAQELGLCFEDQHERPSNDSEISGEAIFNHFFIDRRAPRLVYPDCFVARDAPKWKALWEEKARTNPELFGLHAASDKLIEKQGARKRLPPLPGVSRNINSPVAVPMPAPMAMPMPMPMEMDD